MAQPSGWIQVLLGVAVSLVLLGVGTFIASGVRSVAGWACVTIGSVMLGFTLLSHFDVWSGVGHRHPASVILLVALVTGSIGGGMATFLIYGTASAEADRELRGSFQQFIESGENTRDAFWNDLRRLQAGEPISHIDLYRRTEIERWRERLQECLDQQRVLRPEVRDYIVTGSADRISESIARLREVLRDWATWQL